MNDFIRKTRSLAAIGVGIPRLGGGGGGGGEELRADFVCASAEILYWCSKNNFTR